MDINYLEIIAHLTSAGIGSILTIIILTKFFNADKLMMRKPPLGIVSDSLKYLFMRLRPRKFIYNYWELSDSIKWVDWNRGYGYGYLDEQDQPAPGDVIQVKARKFKGKVMALVFFKIERPDETIPNFFTFRTIYRGIGRELKPEKDKEIGARFKSFQRLI